MPSLERLQHEPQPLRALHDWHVVGRTACRRLLDTPERAALANLKRTRLYLQRTRVMTRSPVHHTVTRGRRTGVMVGMLYDGIEPCAAPARRHISGTESFWVEMG